LNFIINKSIPEIITKRIAVVILAFVPAIAACKRECAGSCDEINSIEEVCWEEDSDDVWLCLDCQCDDSSVPGSKIAAHVQGCAPKCLNPLKVENQLLVCEHVCQGFVCGADTDCRIGECSSPTVPREGMAEVIGRHGCSVGSPIGGNRATQRGDFRVALMAEESSIVIKTSDVDIEAPVRGEFYLDNLLADPEYYDYLIFENMDFYAADFKSNGCAYCDVSIFTVAGVHALVSADNISFSVAPGIGAFGVRGMRGDGKIWGFEAVNHETDAMNGSIDLSTREFRMDIFAAGENGEFAAALVGSIDNVPPVADGGADRQVECLPGSTALLELDASASFDPDPGDEIIHYQWFGLFGEYGSDEGISNQPKVTVNLPAGEHGFMLHVYDMKLGSDSDEVRISVVNAG